tara:strand:- start:1641 stop:2546 length:906 start_codon:yes stop_codon:yes gene_type:complete
MKKTIILYAYYEGLNAGDKKSVCNIRYFLKHGLKKDEKYQFYINISGKSINEKLQVDFIEYKKKYKNLKIIRNEGKCCWDGWRNILEKVDVKEYKYFIFFKDNVIGPMNIESLKKENTNWIDKFTKNIKKNQEVIISGYGVSPLGKLYKLPFVPGKFFCTNRTVVKEMIKRNIFSLFRYDSSNNEKNRMNDLIVKYGENIENIPLNINTDIKLTHFLLENNYNYVVCDNKGITDVGVLRYYNEKDWLKLGKLVEKMYCEEDTYIPNRFFWSNGNFYKIMQNNELILYHRNNIKSLNNIEKW